MTQVAVVTGASRGIGHHLAYRLEQAGYAVERGSRQVADVTDPHAVERWVTEIMERRGRIDLLVNNAGVVDTEVPLAESDPDEWWRVVEVNVRGPYLMTRAVLPPMLSAGAGRIVNLNSGAAYRNPNAATAYSVAKGALARLTAATSLEAARGVRAFDLAPGVVRTDMTEAMAAHRGRTEWTEPAVVAELLLALASGDLDDWNGRLVRAGLDTPASLRARAALGLGEWDRMLTLQRWGADDPLT